MNAMAHRRWQNPELRSVVKLAITALVYLAVLGGGFLAYWLWWD